MIDAEVFGEDCQSKANFSRKLSKIEALRNDPAPPVPPQRRSLGKVNNALTTGSSPSDCSLLYMLDSTSKMGEKKEDKSKVHKLALRGAFRFQQYRLQC